MYGKIYREFIFPFYETLLMRRNTLVYLSQLEKDQWLSEEELKKLQWAKLKKVIAHACKNVPYYRGKFKAAGLNPDDINTPDDFRRIPIVTRSDIQRNEEALKAENYKNKKLFSKTTSGSTGVPLRFWYDRDAYEWHIAAAARSDRWVGWDYGERELYVWGRPPYKISLSKRAKEAAHHTIIRRRIIDTFSLTHDNLKDRIRTINRFSPAVIIGYTTALYNLARFINAKGLVCHKPKGVIASAEKLFSFQRKAIEEAFGAPVFDRYGCQEVMLIACECEKRRGLHVNADNLYVEALKDGRPAGPGETGEIVITDLNNYAMPLIRYRNGDLAVASGRKCACGRGLPLLEKIEGRQLDVITTSGGRMVSGEVFLYILDRFSWVRKYKVIQEEKEALTIYIVREETGDIGKDIALIRAEITKVFGEDMKIEIKFVDEIPLERSGKSGLVLSKTRNNAARKRIKVLHVLMSLEYGGAEKVVVNLIRKMEGRGFEFSICVLDRVGPLKEQLPEGVNITCLNRKGGIDLTLPVRLARVMGKIRPDVIHFHNSTCLFYGAIAAKLAGVSNNIVTQHGISGERKRMLAVLRIASRFLKKAVAVSGNIAEYLNKSYGIGKGQIDLIINGIDEKQFTRSDGRQGRARYGLNGEYVVGHVARLSPEKDQATLLEAFSKVSSRLPKAKLVIVGDGPLRHELEGLADKLKIKDNVIFAGSQKDVRDYLNMFDLFVLSSLREGTSLTLLEAMAAGLPVVATNVGGSPDVIDDGKTGLLVPSRDPDKLADGIIRLLTDKELNEKMGKEARKRIEQYYTLDVMADKYAHIYSGISS